MRHAEALPDEVCQLTKLRLLNVRANHIAALPHDLGNLVDLKVGSRCWCEVDEKLMQVEEVDVGEMCVASSPTPIHPVVCVRRLW